MLQLPKVLGSRVCARHGACHGMQSPACALPTSRCPSSRAEGCWLQPRLPRCGALTRSAVGPGLGVWWGLNSAKAPKLRESLAKRKHHKPSRPKLLHVCSHQSSMFSPIPAFPHATLTTPPQAIYPHVTLNPRNGLNLMP